MMKSFEQLHLERIGLPVTETGLDSSVLLLTSIPGNLLRKFASKSCRIYLQTPVQKGSDYCTTFSKRRERFNGMNANSTILGLRSLSKELNSHEVAFESRADKNVEVWLTANMGRLLNCLALRKDGTVNRRFTNFVTRKAASKRNVDGVRTVDITINVSTGVWCRIFVPTWADPDKMLPLMIYFHGGGFVLHNPASEVYDSHCRRLSKMCEVIVISVAYRLSPEYKEPTAYEDGFAAVEWLISQSSQPHEDFPIAVADFSRVFIAGDSSGGNLAHHVAARSGSINVSPISMAGVILLQPFFGGERRTGSEIRYKNGKLANLKVHDWFWQAFLQPGFDKDHPSCNVCGPKSPSFLSVNLPKILVIVGGKDPLQDRQIEYSNAMQLAGKTCKLVVFETAFHAFYVFKSLKSTRLLLNEIEEFVNPPIDGNKSWTGKHIDMVSPRASDS